jgi:hypothetical protein
MKQIQAIALLPILCFSLAASAADLTMNIFVQIGQGAATVSDLTNSGASVTYETKNDLNDIGIAATNNNATPVYRVGFDFGSTAL